MQYHSVTKERELYISDLEILLSETTDEKRRKEIEWEIEGFKLKLLHPPAQLCCPPQSRTRITGRKAKPKKEDRTAAAREGIAQLIKNLKEQIAKADSVDLMIDLRRKILVLEDRQNRVKDLTERLAIVANEDWKKEIREEIENLLFREIYYLPPFPYERDDDLSEPPW